MSDVQMGMAREAVENALANPDNDGALALAIDDLKALAALSRGLPYQMEERYQLMGYFFEYITLTAEGFIPETDKQDEVNAAVDRARQEMGLLSGDIQRYTEALVQSVRLMGKLKHQRDQRTRQYAALVQALQHGDESHPLVAEFVELFMEPEDGGIIDQLEQVLGDSDAASTIADLALGRGSVPADDLKHVITVLLEMYQRQMQRAGE